VKLTATTEVPPPAGSFLIGNDVSATASNFNTALGLSFDQSAKTELRAASTFAAAENFFSADGKPKIPEAVAAGGKPTKLVDGSSSIVQWYTGDISANPRGSVSSNIDDTSRVNYGMQANESGFLHLIRSQAAAAVSTYPSEEAVRSKDVHEEARLKAMALPEGAERNTALAEYEAKVTADYRLSTGFFDGMAKRQQSELSEAHNTESGSIEIITMEIGVAQGALQSATTRHKDYKAQLNNLLSEVETVSKEDVAMEILALQTRLQASFQTTAMVSQLSLVNFI
jgi:flagellar hook-associated protein 3 FlgL